MGFFENPHGSGRSLTRDLLPLRVWKEVLVDLLDAVPACRRSLS
jgi:hypothetical protein